MQHNVHAPFGTEKKVLRFFKPGGKFIKSSCIHFSGCNMKLIKHYSKEYDFIKSRSDCTLMESVKEKLQLIGSNFTVITSAISL